MAKEYDLSFLDKPELDKPKKDYGLSFLDENEDLEATHKAQEAEKKKQEQQKALKLKQEEDARNDPANWSSDQLKDYYKENPPQNVEEKVKADLAMKVKKDAEKQAVNTLFKSFMPGGAVPDVGKMKDMAEPIMKGMSEIAFRSPQVLGSLIQELGERATEMPDMSPGSTDAMISQAAPVYPIMKTAKALLHKKLRIDKDVTAFGKKMVADNKKWIEKNIPDYGPTGESGFKDFLYHLGSGATTLGAALGITYLTKNPGAAAVLFGVYQKGDIYQRAREKGKTPREAGELSTLAGGVEGILEYLGLEFLISAAGANKFLSALAKAGVEGIQEFSQTTGENLIIKFGGIDKAQPILQGAGMSTLVGFVLGGGVGLAIDTAQETGLIEDIKAETGLSAEKATQLLKNVIGKQETVVEETITQKEMVKKAVEEKPKKIKEVAEETKILEPNVRRILGVGTKEGVFTRVDKGVYFLNKDGKDLAYIQTGDAIEILPKLVSQGVKSDMIFLDIPYKTPAVVGGNRGIKYDYITPDQFKTVVDNLSQMTRNDDTPIFYMYSQARSGKVAMQKYNDVLLNAGFKPVARGDYTKLQMDGVTRVRNMRGDIIEPEAIILFNKSGNFDAIKDEDIKFKLIRPKGYQTEKPRQMLMKLIRMSTKEGEVVLDPFAGSGVAAEQAIKAGRKAVAIEKKPEAVEKYIKPRVEKAAEERATPAEEKPQALSSRAWGKEMPKEPEDKLKINKTQILKWVEEKFKVPIRGKATRRGFHAKAGHYEQGAELIRLRVWGELEVMTHEIAHHIDKNMMKSLGQYWRREFVPKGQKQKALKELANLDYSPSQRRTSEGFAEFIRYYLTTEEAATKAPTFHKFFTEVFLPQNKDFADNLAQLKKKMDAWYKQGSENRILEQIDFTGEHTAEKGFVQAIVKAKEWILKNFHDEFYLIKKIEEQLGLTVDKNIRPSQSPFVLATYAKSKAGVVARTMVMEKMIDAEGNVLGPGLKEILADISSKEMRSFLAYAVAKRAALLHQRGKQSGFDGADIRYILEKYQNSKWDTAVDQLTQWSDSLIEWLVKSGGLGSSEAELIRKLNPIYLPFKRAFLDSISFTKGPGGFVNIGQAIKRLKGSGRAILNPLEAMIAQATELVAKSQKIRVARAVANLAGKEGIGNIIVKVPAPLKVTKFPIVEAIKQLYKKDLVDIPEDVKNAINEAEEGGLDGFLTMFGQDWQYKGKDNIISIWRGGERHFYEVHPDLYRALSGIDMMKRGFLMKILGPPARLLRLGATSLRISFGIARNPFRDAFTYAVFAKRKSATIFDPILGLYKDITAKPGELVWRFKAVGGQLSGQMGLDRASTMSVYDDLLFNKLSKVGKTLHVAKHPIDAISKLINLTRDVLSLTEMAPRSMEVEHNYKHYKKTRPDWTDEDAFIQAFNDAQDVTVNFTKSGYFAKRINEVTAFFNVAIRGPEKLYRAIRERPVITVMKGLTWVTSLALWNWFKNRDKEWYRNLPPAYKYNNFFIEMGNIIVRLPIPFDLGILFASLPMAMMDYYETHDPKYLEGLQKQVLAQIPDPTPTLFQPMIDVAANRDFLGKPIESEGMQYLYPTERKRHYTSEVAKSLSKGFVALGIPLSPVQIDYMLNSYTGGWIRQLPIRPVLEPADIPVIGDLLLRMPERPMRQLNSYFADYERLQSKKSADIATPEELRELNRIKPIYKMLTRGYFKQMRRYREQQNIEAIKNTYKRIADLLARYGYS